MSLPSDPEREDYEERTTPLSHDEHTLPLSGKYLCGIWVVLGPILLLVGSCFVVLGFVGLGNDSLPMGLCCLMLAIPFILVGIDMFRAAIRIFQGARKGFATTILISLALSAIMFLASFCGGLNFMGERKLWNPEAFILAGLFFLFVIFSIWFFLLSLNLLDNEGPPEKRKPPEPPREENENQSIHSKEE